MPSSPISPCPSCPPHAARGHGCAVYSSSVTDAQWAILEPLLPAPGSTAGRGGRPEKHCRRAIVDAILYIVRGGIAWRQCFSGRPPRPAVLPSAGNSGSRIAHCASVTDGRVHRATMSARAGADGHGEIGDDGIVGSWSGRGLGNHRPQPRTDFFGSPRRTRPPIAVLKHSLRAGRVGEHLAQPLDVAESRYVRALFVCLLLWVGVEVVLPEADPGPMSRVHTHRCTRSGVVQRRLTRCAVGPSSADRWAVPRTVPLRLPPAGPDPGARHLERAGSGGGSRSARRARLSDFGGAECRRTCSAAYRCRNRSVNTHSPSSGR